MISISCGFSLGQLQRNTGPIIVVQLTHVEQLMIDNLESSLESDLKHFRFGNDMGKLNL
jgi:hypothetical protein